MNHATFDDYAENYEEALAESLSVSGESREYFAERRIAWLAQVLPAEFKPGSVMDFGCGTGAALPYFFSLLGARSAIGIDVSEKSLAVARTQFGNERTCFKLMADYVPKQEIDLAFCSGVFHHIPMDLRSDALEFIYQSLKPGGCFALWENNPWNPGTRYVMSKCPFDKEAITLSPPTARRLVQSVPFAILRTDFQFIFPKFLRSLRGLEPLVSRWPIGAQYQILCRKPS